MAGLLRNACLGDDHVTPEGGVRDLAVAVAVRDANDHAVLGGVVLVSRLGDEPLARTVVGFALAPAAELGLVALEVRIVLHELDERHGLLLQRMVSAKVRWMSWG